MEDIIEDYRNSLADLTQNSKPLINMLTMLAEDNETHAGLIVEAIETHLQQVYTFQNTYLVIPPKFDIMNYTQRWFITALSFFLMTLTYNNGLRLEYVHVKHEALSQIDFLIHLRRQTYVNIVDCFYYKQVFFYATMQNS